MWITLGYYWLLENWLHFERQRKFKYYTKFKVYKPCQTEFSVSKEKEHFTISNREEPMDCNTLNFTLCELLDKSISYSLKKPTYFNLSFMITGLESISLCFCQTNGKIHHLLLTSVTQNNINKCTEERPIKQFSLTLNLVFHNRPHICPTFCLPTWPVLHSGILSSKFFEVCSSRFMHYRPSQDQHRLRTSSL